MAKKESLQPVEALGSDKKDQEKAKIKAQGIVERMLGSLKLGFTNSKSLYSSLKASLEKSLEGVDKEWSDLRVKTFDTEELSEGFQHVLKDKTQPIEKKVERITNMIAGYIAGLAHGADRGKINPNEIAKARDSLVQNTLNFRKLIELPENEKLMSAFEWAVGSPIEGKEDGPSMTEYKDTAIKTLKDELRKAPTFDISNDRVSVVWMIIAFMKDKDSQKKILKDISEELSGEKKQEFIETANRVGIIGPKSVGELLGKTLTQEEIKKYGELYEKQHVFKEAADLMTTITYGAENDALRMLSGKNILKSLVMLWGGITLGANLAVGLSTDQNYKRPLDFFMNLPGNLTGVWLPIAAMAGVSIDEETGASFFEGKGSRESAAETHSQKIIKEKITKNPKWGSLLTAEEYNGSKAIFAYMNSKVDGGKVDPSEVKMEDFLSWLDLQERSSDPKKQKYASLKKEIKVEKGEDKKVSYALGGMKVEHSEFQAMCSAIFILEAGGQEAEAKIETIMKQVV